MPPVDRRPVSGRYRGEPQDLVVELRVDVDGSHPTHRVSADYFRTHGREHEHLRSMRIDAPRVKFEPAKVTITGHGAWSQEARHQSIRVTIPRVAAGLPQPPARLEHLGSDGSTGARYVLAFESEYFRRVEFEEAVQRGVRRFVSYDTGELTSPAPARTLSSISAFAEAGVEMVPTREPLAIDTARAGANATWSDAELHAAMEASFTRWRDRPQWAIWLLHATDHDDPAIGGLMFDRRGVQRQGCAIFYGSRPRSGADAERNRLHSCVHELGHGFNLLHSWQKSLAVPPVPSRPDALSWMNYPERFSRGTERFWSTFGFQFDEPELVHLRHGFQHEVIMGGAPLRGGAARIAEDNWSGDRQDPGLRLRLSCDPTFSYGVPVTVSATLSATAARGREVPVIFGPQAGSLDVLIRTPRGEESVFVPLLRHCRGQEAPTMLEPGRPLRSQPFIHYGQNGFSFPMAGRYTLRARFAGSDGRIALSDAVSLRVLAPITRADREIERLIGGDEQVATLLTLLGSDAPQLGSAEDKLKQVIERYPAHPAAAAARVAIGTNLARTFKRIATDGSVVARRPRPMQAAALIGSVIDIAAVRRAASGARTPAQERHAVSGALLRVGARPGIAPAVGGFVVSRRQELTAVREVVVAGVEQLLQEAHAERTRPWRRRRLIPDDDDTSYG